MSLNIWVIGNGAREQAIKAACEKSPLCRHVELIDDLTEELLNGELRISCSFFRHARALLQLSSQKATNLSVPAGDNNDDLSYPDLVIFGTEQQICDGWVDKLQALGIKCIGVNKKFSRLESSKLFAKKFMAENRIKCAKLLPIESNEFPQVLKFDGLCKGKGVKVVYNNDEKNAFARKFPGMRYFIEEYLEGDEISVMSYFYNGRLINFRPARDFKRLSNGPDAPNTGGMGAYTPVNLSDEQKQKLQIYLSRLEDALLNENADFNGFIYSGLIWTRNDWYVLEYNVRLGDPECQAILTNLKNDFLDILLNGSVPEYKEGTGACLTLAAEGYPDTPIKGDEIILPNIQDVIVYHASVEIKDGKLYSNGGRVLSLCVNNENPFPILKNYAEHIVMEHKYFRKDIEIY